MALQLMQHQRQFVELARTQPRYGVFFEPGLGKTITLLSVVNEQGGKTVVVAPKSVLWAAWAKDAEHFPNLKTVVCWAGSAAKRRKLIATPGADVLVMNFEAFKAHLPDLVAAGVTRLIVDECFPAGTPVETPGGYRSIESIQPGDPVMNAVGVDTVVSTTKRILRKAVKIKIDGGRSIISSPNHPFFTARGLVQAGDLEPGDELLNTSEAVRILRDKAPGTARETILRVLLLDEMEKGERPGPATDLHARGSGQDVGGTQKALREREAVCAGEHRTYQATQSDVEPGNSPEKFRVAAADGIQAEGTWRQRADSALAAGAAVSISAGGGLGDGVRGHAWRKRAGLSDQLQSGPCDSGDQIGGGGGRQQSRLPQGVGRQEGPTAGYARVESVEVLQRGHPEFDRLSCSHDPDCCVFYDLEVDRHPSYGVLGVLVHNCSKLKNDKSQISKAAFHFSQAVGSVYLLSGTPAPNGAHEYFALMRCIDPDLFGTNFWRFINSYFMPIKRTIQGKDRIIGFKFLSGAEPRFLAKLQTRSKSLRAVDCLDLPAETDEIRDVMLEPSEMQVYADLLTELAHTWDDGETTLVKLETRSMKLRQVTGGTLYDADHRSRHVGDSKLKDLLELLDELGKQPLVVWCEFTSEIDKVTEGLGEAGYNVARIDGRTHADTRARLVDDFQAGRLQVLVCHPAACGHGITLTAARFDYFYSLGFVPENHDQARKRIHRIGQHWPVVHYYAIARGTVDEKTLKVLKRKATAAEAIKEVLAGVKRETEVVA